jgi:ribonuclease Z
MIGASCPGTAADLSEGFSSRLARVLETRYKRELVALTPHVPSRAAAGTGRDPPARSSRDRAERSGNLCNAPWPDDTGRGFRLEPPIGFRPVDLDVIFFGTGASVPSARRNTASVLVRRGGDRLLFDCGEGTQRQMLRSTGLVQVHDIFITHLHADHYLGLPGLLKTWDLQDRVEPLVIYGPPGLRGLISALSRTVGRLGYEVELDELEAGDRVNFDGYTVESFPVEHRITAYGYLLREQPRPGRFDRERALELGVAEGPDFGRLQGGEEVPGSEGSVRPEQVLSAERPGRRLVISGDTAPCAETAAAADGAQLLVHDACFGDAEVERAAETGHSTARQAGELAAAAGVGMLALVHISARHFVPEILEQARAAFPGAVAPRDFDLIEIPFPERGAPELHADGARAQPAAESG